MSWREADDPRCPECGEKISPTAYYCMHCHADLPGEVDTTATDSPDEILADDREPQPSAGFDRSEGLGSKVGESVDSLTSRHKLDGVAGRLASMLVTDVPEPEGVPRETFTAPLWMRIPLALVAGVFVFIAVGIGTVLLFGEWLGPLGGVVTLALLVGIIWWLARKPLPSDIVADACYAIALALLLMPAAFAVNSGLSRALAGGSVNDVLFEAVILQVFVIFPASVFLVIGFVGNRYARSKLDTIAESSTRVTDR